MGWGGGDIVPFEVLKDLFFRLNKLQRFNRAEKLKRGGKKIKGPEEERLQAAAGPRPAGSGPNGFLQYAKDNRSVISLSTQIHKHTCVRMCVRRSRLHTPV